MDGPGLVEDKGHRAGSPSPRSRAITRRVLVGFILIPVGALSLLALLFLAYFERTFEDRVLEGLSAVAAVQTHRVGDLVEGESRRLALLSSRTQLRLSLRDHLEAPAPAPLETMRRILSDARAADDAILELMILDPDGRAVVSTQAASIGTDHRGRRHFEVGRVRDTAASPALDERGRLVLYSSGPLVLEGRMLGVLVVQASADHLREVVGDTAGLGQTGETFVTRTLSDGRTLYLAPLRFDPKAAMRRELTGPGPLLQAVSSRRDEILTQAVDYRGAAVLAVVRNPAAPPWSVVVKIDRDEALAPVGRMRAFLAAALLACCVAAALTGWVVARKLGAAADAGERAERAELEHQLHESQKAEALGRMAGGLAHELGNILMAIEGRLGLLREQVPAGSALSAGLDDMAQAGERATRLLKQLKAFARSTAPDPRVVNLNDVVRGLEPMIQALLGQDIERVTELNPDLGHTRLDPSQMEQVLMNLAINARDAMPQGGRLTIATDNVELDESFARTQPGLLPGPYVRLEVVDTGIGMDEATRARIFEPFFSSKPSGQGMGLGLAMVEGIVHRSWGAIVVESQPGRGSRFQLFFPRAEAGEPTVGASRPG